MKYRISGIVLIVTLLVLSFSFVFLCNAIENTDDFKTEKIGIVVKKENISDSNWWVDYNSLGIDSIQKIIPVFEDSNGDVYYNVYHKTNELEDILELKAELEKSKKIDFVGLIGYVSSEPAAFDVTLDGKVTAEDARFALRCSIGLESCSALQLLRGDTDGNGKVTAEDARCILRCSVGLPAEIDEKYDFAVDSLIISIKEECMPDTTELTPEFFENDLIKEVEYLLGNRAYCVYLNEPGEDNLFRLKEYLENNEKIENVEFNMTGQTG